MNGPEHYREAEKLTKAVEHHVNVSSVAQAVAVAGLAQVHATLAVAAAIAMRAAIDGGAPGMGSGEFDAWYRAAGVQAPKDGADDGQ